MDKIDKILPDNITSSHFLKKKKPDPQSRPLTGSEYGTFFRQCCGSRSEKS